MKVHILNYDPERTGGGWTQARYLYDGIGNATYDDSDVVLITGPTMVTHDQVEKAKSDGKGVVFRIDNAVRDSRNRGTGMSRMRAFAKLADLVIYQSKWARDFLYQAVGRDGEVILNGVDTKRFTSGDPQDGTYLYVRSSRDEGKQWIMAWYWWIQHQQRNPEDRLDVVGRFSSENLDWNFDFYNEENYNFWGEQKNMPAIFRRNKYFLYTYLNEAGSNTLLEARASGCEIVDVYGMAKTGSAPEYLALEDISVERMLEEYKNVLSLL